MDAHQDKSILTHPVLVALIIVTIAQQSQHVIFAHMAIVWITVTLV